MTMPLIPYQLAQLPMANGLIVPYISVDYGDGTYQLGETHTRKVNECIMNGLCQICGIHITPPVVLLVTDSDLELGWTGEPGMHAQCARYSATACPMIAGKMPTYKRSGAKAPGKPCDKPGCDCDGWVQNDGQHRPPGTPAPKTWHFLWLEGYATVVDKKGDIRGVGWQGMEPLKVRPVVRQDES